MYARFTYRNLLCSVLCLQQPDPVLRWRTLEIFNLVFKCNGKIEGFFFLEFSSFNESILSKRRKRKPIGRKYKQNERNDREGRI